MLHIESGGIVFIDGKVLLRKTKKEHLWIFPKGHIEQGENPKIAAEREVLEETGVRAIAETYLGQIDYNFQNDPFVVHLFHMKYVEYTDAWPNHKDVDSFLFLPEDALQLLSFEDYKTFLRRAIDGHHSKMIAK